MKRQGRDAVLKMSGQVYAIGACYLLPCSALAVPCRGFGHSPFWHVFAPATALGCNSKGPARHTSSGPRQAVCISLVVAQKRVRQGCLLGWCWLGLTSSCTCWWHKWYLLLLLPVMALPQEQQQTTRKDKAPWCWAAYTVLTTMPTLPSFGWGAGVGPCGSCVVLSGHRE